MPGNRRRELYALLLAVFGVAFTLRLVYVGHLGRLPFFDHPVMDPAYHDTWAREILSGKWSTGEPFFRAPLYPYFLAFIYWLSKGSYLLPRIVQAVLGGMTSLIACSLAARYFGRLAGIVAGFVAAVYPVLIYFDGELLTEPLFTFLTMGGLWLLERATARGSPRLVFTAGLAFGLALTTRPNVGLFLPFAAAGVFVLSRRRLALVILLAAGAVLPVVPVSVYNYATSGEFIPLVWQDGLNFYLGNNPASDGWSATSPELRKDWWGGYRDMIAIPREALGREPKYREVSGFWYRKGLGYIRSDPLGWAGLMLKKAALFWSPREYPNNQDFRFMQMHSWVLRNPVGFRVIAPLALTGLVIFWPARRRLCLPYALFLTFFGGTVLFFVCDRYRITALPVMIVVAGGAVARLAQAWRERDLRRLPVYGGLVVCFAGFVNSDVARVPAPDLAMSYTALGKVYGSIGDDTRAAEYFNRAIATNPAYGEAYEQLGIISMKAGDKQEARAYLVKAVQVWPGLATAHRALAMLYLSEGEVAVARRSIEEALRLAPYLEDAHNVLGSIQRTEGKAEQALTSFRKELEINPSSWRAHANMGAAYEEMGDLEEARKAYEKAIEMSPRNPEVILPLATLEAKAGRYAVAESLLGDSASGVPQDINLRYNRAVILQNQGRSEEALSIYEGILRDNPLHEGALVNLGVIYARQGRGSEALDLWQKALSVNPSNQTARRNIELLRERSE